jgi:hypothetical protein
MGYLYLGHPGGEEYATSGNHGLLDIRDGLLSHPLASS